MFIVSIARFTRTITPSALSAWGSIQQRCTFVTKKSTIQTPRSTKTVRIYEKENSADVVPKENLPYNVKRTTLAKWLPVYREFRNGGTNISTILRRIDGNIDRLAKDLEIVAPAGRIQLRKDLGQIRLRGDYLHDVREFLTVRKF
ncbi:hypothetical protein HDU97_001077 [Phlyctochytrium planicorne]|nr:hypothetical protein HDU97_001077 [Phlyctochytrium planicorne]